MPGRSIVSIDARRPARCHHQQNPQDHLQTFRKAFQSRRDLVVRRVAQIDGLTLDAPGGAFYAYIGIHALIGAKTPGGETIKTDTDFTAYLLKQAGIASVPGSAYDLAPFFRLSTATSEDILSAAMDRIAAAVAKLEKA